MKFLSAVLFSLTVGLIVVLIEHSSEHGKPNSDHILRYGLPYRLFLILLAAILPFPFLAVTKGGGNIEKAGAGVLYTAFLSYLVHRFTLRIALEDQSVIYTSLIYSRRVAVAEIDALNRDDDQRRYSLVVRGAHPIHVDFALRGSHAFIKLLQESKWGNRGQI
jgi:hypothetical protein